MRKLLVVLLIIVLFVQVKPVQADIAPPNRPPGTNPQPGSETTSVRMVAETVTIDVQSRTSGKELGFASVSAEFTMRNLGDADETMAVRFPVGASDGWGGIPVITDTVVSVGGKNVALRSITGEDPNFGADEVPWVEFDVTFPSQADVQIVVKYTLQAVGELPYIWFNYIFSTGAGWNGTIGSADLVVNFPYEVNELNVLVCDADDTYSCTTRGGRMEGKRITWRFEDFEPDVEDNFTLYIAAPSEWAKVLTEKTNVETNPRDGEAWGRLGRAYKALIFSPHGRRGFRSFSLLTDSGAQELVRLSDEAYSKALDLKPDDAQWRAGYADLLGYYGYYAGFEGVETIPVKVKALQEIQRALEQAPNDEIVKTIAMDLSFLFPDGMVENGEFYDFPWLTQTPVATVTQLMPEYASVTPDPQEVPAAVDTPVPPTSTRIVPTNTSQPVETTPEKTGGILPICGSVILLPFMLVVGTLTRRLKV